MSRKAAKGGNTNITVSVKDSSSRTSAVTKIGDIVALPERSVKRTDWFTLGGDDVVQLKSPRK